MRRRSSLLTLAALASLLALPACTGVLSAVDPPEPIDGGGIFIDVDTGPLPDGALPDAGPLPPGFDAGPLPPDFDAGPGAPDAGPPAPDAGPLDPCTGVTCQANAVCVSGDCRCSEGFSAQGGACVALPAGDPALRSEADVCAEWNAGHVMNASPAWTDGPGCDPGTLSQEGIDDTLRRVNLFRWLAGLGPITHDSAGHQGWMECAYMMDRNNALSHSPPGSWTCHTAAGASAAGSSNIALGYATAASSIDGYMRDGNTPSLGHRRWILGGRLSSVQIGSAGRGHCLGVFNGGGSTDRGWTAYPNQGVAPLATATNTWSFQFNSISMQSGTDVEMERLDGTPLAVDTYQLSGGSGPPATIAWDPDGWTPTAGESYRVTITDTSAGDVSYEVHLADC